MIGSHGEEDKNTQLFSEQHKEDHVVVKSGSSLVEDPNTEGKIKRKGLPTSSTIQEERRSLDSCGCLEWSKIAV